MTVAKTRDEFFQLSVVRRNGQARIVYDTYKAEPGCQHPEADGKPVHLLYFAADAELSDFEVLEQGWAHYRLLLAEFGITVPV